MNGQPDALAAAARIVPCPEAPPLAIGTQRLLFKLLLVVSDVLALGLAFRISYWVRFDLGLTVSPEVVPDPQYYPQVGGLLLPLFLLALAWFRLYEPHELLGGVLEYSRVFQACSTVTLIVILAGFVMPQFVISRMWVVAVWLVSFLLVLLNRFICRRLAYFLRVRGYLLVPAVIVGSNQEAMTLAADLRDLRGSGLRLLGMVSSESGPEADDREAPPVLGRVSDIRRVVQEHGVEDVIVAITALSRQELLRLCEDVNSLPGVHLRLSSGLYEILTTGVTVRTLGNVPLVSLNKVHLEPHQLLAKTALEYSVVIAGLLVLWPVFLVLALLVRFDSPGPIFHRRRVLGASGRQFDAFKFRTMVVNGDALLEQRPELGEELRTNHKLKDDPRVTRIGRWLRKYSLDELPQLFNVLLGQMSVVGPRMISADEVEKYGRHKLNLLTVKPGITGLWQVSGRSDVSYDQRVQFDMYYIRNYSVWLDLQILFVQTVPTVIRGRGAY